MLIVEICFGVLIVFGKLSFASFEPITVFLIRTLGIIASIQSVYSYLLGSLPVVVLLAIIYEFESFEASFINWRTTFKNIFVCIGLVQSIGFFCYHYGLKLTSPINAAALWLTVTPFTVCFGMLFGHEKKSRWKILGVLLAVGGALITIDVLKYSYSGLRGLFGDLLVVLAALFFSLYLTFTKPLSEGLGTLTFSFWYFFSLSCWSLLATVAVWCTIGVVATGSVEPFAWTALSIAVVIGTTIPYIINNWVIVNSPPLVAAIYTPVELGATVFFSSLMLSQEMRWHQGLGAGIIIIGLVIVLYAQYREGHVTKENYIALETDEELEDIGPIEKV
jgi:drug/metabolite transporter (DMT)-like permease